MRSHPSLKGVPSFVVGTVGTLVCVLRQKDLLHPFKEDRRSLPLSTPVLSRHIAHDNVGVKSPTTEHGVDDVGVKSPTT